MLFADGTIAAGPIAVCEIQGYVYDAKVGVAELAERLMGDAAFAERLRADGVDAQVDLYGAGTHNWVYWQRELHAAWPLIAGGLGIGP
jgi:S-formylglutathione hydrolase FrmB